MENCNNDDKNSSPLKHRHDGTSPLPLGMDWSPPPKKWDGRYSVWPHDPHMGWSYCVMVPSWIVQPESGVSTDGSFNTVFFRVLVGIQSPEGVSISHVILRRFSDFLKLFYTVKRVFYRKNIPPAPPKNFLSKVYSSQLLLEERRCALEEWIGRLLSDIDLSRSAPVATFLELEAAVRSSHNMNQHASETSTLGNDIAKATLLLNGPISGASVADLSGPSISLSTPSEFSSINGTSRQGDAPISEFSTDDIVSTHASSAARKMSHNIILEEKPEEMFKSESQHGKVNLVSERDSFCGNSSKASLLSGDHGEFTAEQKQDNLFCPIQNLSTESIRSDISSNKGSELSNPCTSNSLGDGSASLLYGSEAPMEDFGNIEMHCVNDVFVIHPVDQRHKLNKFLATMQQRLVAAKADMGDLIARLNHDIAVEDYLKAKVKDLEVKLESARQKNKEDLQQAVLLERERVTQIQWDADELHRSYKSMESKLKYEQNEKARAESKHASFGGEKELLLQELKNKTEQLIDLQKRQEELERKSKSDIKVLVKEVKFLRSSEVTLKEVFSQSLMEKTELERILQKEKQRRRHISLARKKLIFTCEDLRRRLQESSVNFLAEGEHKFTVDPSLLSDALGLLTTSDTRIDLLLAKAQLLGQEDEQEIPDADGNESSEFEPADTPAANIDDDPRTVSDDEMRTMLSDAIADIAILRKQNNAVVRCALKTIIKPQKDNSRDEAPPRKTFLDKFLRR